MSINGNLTLSANSTIDIEVAGTDPFAPEFDQIAVTGTAALAGTLNATLLGTFIADKSESFRFLTFASSTGDFTTFNKQQIAGRDTFVKTLGSTFYDLVGNLLVVRNTNDNGAFSLRNQINAANTGIDLDMIVFNLAGPGPFIINVGSDILLPNAALPAITTPLVIEGTTLPAYTGTPVIILNGSSVNALGNGLELASGSSGSTIKGLALQDFPLNGVLISSSNNTLDGNYIGTEPTGSLPHGVGDDGIEVTSGANNNLIRNNLIVDSGANGLFIKSNGNRLFGNTIGTNLLGNAALGNQAAGVMLLNASDNTIGTDGDGVNDAAEGNLISGNGLQGIGIDGNSDRTRISGNIIGLNRDGSLAIPNMDGGIQLYSALLADNTLIGTDGDGISDIVERNVISGNDTVGIFDSGTGTVIAGNRIGTNSFGTVSIGNSDVGVLVAGVNGTVGGASSSMTNLISGNLVGGIQLTATASDVVIRNNLVGLSISGDTALSTGGRGLNISGSGHLVQDNVISGNLTGIRLNDATNNQIMGNFIVPVRPAWPILAIPASVSRSLVTRVATRLVPHRHRIET